MASEAVKGLEMSRNTLDREGGICYARLYIEYKVEHVRYRRCRPCLALLRKAHVMEDMVPRTDHTAYTEQELALAEGFKVEPSLIRALRDVAERIRETNVSNWSNPLVG